jgi:hypothetical protein
MRRAKGLAVAAVLALSCELVWGGQFAISGRASGSVNDQTLTVTIEPAVEDVGKSGATYIAALLSTGQWFFLTEHGWLPWASGDYPTFATGTLGTTTATPLQHMDVSGLPGAAIYAGYGTSSASMLANGTYALVYRVGGALPSVSGTASVGTWSGPTITAFGLDGAGSRSSVLGTTTADAQGNFNLSLVAYPASAVEVVASGGNYQSLHDGAARSRGFAVSALLPSVGASVSGLGVTPISDLVAKRAAELLLTGATPTQASSIAARTVETIFGLQAGASSAVPRFDADAITQAPAASQVALVVGALESLGAANYPAFPEIAAVALSVDLADGVFDGRRGNATITVSGVPMATDLGTAKLVSSALTYASAYAGGVLPAAAATITPTYTSRAIPAYVAQTIPPYRAGVTAAYTANPAPMTPDTRGPSSAAGYSCSNGATLSFPNGRATCSDGSIAIFTAPTIQPYTPGLVTPFESAVVGSDVSTGTIPVYTSVSDIHVFTPAERAAMMANSSNLPAGWTIPQGPLTEAQVDAYGVLNHNIQVWYSGNPFRMSF